MKEKPSPDPHRTAGAIPPAESIRSPYLPSPEGLVGMSTAEIRSRFLPENLFKPDRVVIYHSELDRATVGGAVPGSGPLGLLAPPDFRADAFVQRREIGVFNRCRIHHTAG